MPRGALTRPGPPIRRELEGTEDEPQEGQEEQEALPPEDPAPMPYKMPSIFPGEIVLWSHTPDAEAYAAVVTRVGYNAVSLFMMPPDSRRGEIRDGVRHVSDPELPRLINEGGCWRDTRSMALLRELGRLRRRSEWTE